MDFGVSSEKTDGKERARLDYLDYMRAVGILLIIMHHSFQYYEVYDKVVSYITTFHVSIFFVISGYIAGIRYKDDYSLKNIVISRARSMLIPYIVFSCINSFLKLAVMGIEKTLTKEIVKLEMTDFFITGNGTVWFLATLFLVEVLFYLFKGEHESVVYALSGIILGIMPFFIWKNNSPIEIVLKRVMEGYAFFVWGYFLGRYILRRIRWKLAAGLILLGAGLIIWGGNGNCIMSYFNGEFGGTAATILVNVCSTLSILLFMYLLDNKTKQKIKWLSYLGRNSLTIMLVHPIFLMCYIHPFGSGIAEYSERMQWIAGIVLCLVLIVLEIPSIELIERYFPFMIGKKKND